MDKTEAEFTIKQSEIQQIVQLSRKQGGDQAVQGKIYGILKRVVERTG